jgi:hypothetical protein
VKRFYQIALLVSASGSTVIAQPDPVALIRQSVVNYERSWRAGMQWGYTQTDMTADDGKQQTDVSQIIPIDGTPYERLIAKDSKPLSSEELAKEDRKYEREVQKRREESPAERQTRIEKYEKQRAFINDLPEAYDFTLAGEETLAGRPAWVVTMSPKRGYIPTSAHAELLKHIDGKLWIDKEDFGWVKCEAHVIDTISVGLILARIGPGARITLDLERIAPGLWMPRQIAINGSARVLLVHTKNLNEHLQFTDYHLGPPKPPSTQVAHALPTH